MLNLPQLWLGKMNVSHIKKHESHTSESRSDIPFAPVSITADSNQWCKYAILRELERDIQVDNYSTVKSNECLSYSIIYGLK